MIDIQTILTYLTLISIPVGVFYHIMTLNNTRKNQQLQLETRQAQLLMNLSDTYRDKTFRNQYYSFLFQHEWDDFDDWWSKYDPTKDVNAIADTGALMGFYEGIGFLVKRNLVDVEYVIDLFGPGLSLIWEKYKPLLYGSRDFLGVHIYPNLEYLANELEKRNTSQTPNR